MVMRVVAKGSPFKCDECGNPNQRVVKFGQEALTGVYVCLCCLKFALSMLPLPEPANEDEATRPV
jgi:hypothetical protein